MQIEPIPKAQPDPQTEPGGVSCASLSWTFLLIGLMGFGGVQVPAHLMIVERRRWLSEAEFSALLGVGQILPGGNMMNVSVMIGDRFQGLRGSFICIGALLSAPLVILIGAAMLYDRFGRLGEVRSALAAVAASAAGMVIATGLKMGRRLKPDVLAIGLGLAAFTTVGVLRWSLPLCVLCLAPIGVLMAKPTSPS